MRQARWEFSKPNPDAESALKAALGVRAATARVLAARGFDDGAEAERFLRPTLEGLNDPYQLAGMREAVARLRAAIAGREKILIYGDYDVDGTTAVTILRKAIEMAGGAAEFHVPHRLKEGYGIHAEAIARAAADGVRLMVSVDTGIRAGDVVRGAGERGIDVIVTDHHLPDEALPPAVAVLNPNRRDCAYPNKSLCGAGVAFQLARALLGTMGWTAARLDAVTESFLKMAAMATVADVVPLTGENRVIVKHGLAGLGAVKNAGLRALLDSAGFGPGKIPTATEVAFRIAPRINAAGRMADAAEAIELFTTADAGRAREIAAKLDGMNRERQKKEAEILKTILEDGAAEGEMGAALVFSGEGWHRGVAGIVASRVVERFGRPAFVLGEEDGVARGSGRSAGGFHLLEALEAMRDLFDQFGGHRQAAGVTLAAARVPEFRERLRAHAAARLTEEDFRPVVKIDTVVEFGELDEGLVREMEGLAPFGFGNRQPVLAALGAEVAAPPQVVKEKHLRVSLRKGGKQVKAIAWGFAERAAELQPGARVDAAFCVELDEVGRAYGREGWQAVLRDVRGERKS